VGEAGVDLDRDPAVAVPASPVVDRAEHVAGFAHVCGHQEPHRLADRGAAQGEVTHLLLVAGARAQRPGEDRGVGGDADDAALGQLGQITGPKTLAAEIVEPDGDGGVGEVG
jgi:hypothetical protein